MKMGNAKEKFTAFCRKVGKKNMMIAGAFVIVAVALVIALTVFGGSEDKGFDYSQGTGLTPPPADTSQNSTDADADDSYFSSVQVSRQRNRDEALEVLQSVVDSAKTDDVAKTQALADISQIAKDMEAESNIETLIVAKGFEQCVAIINDGMCTVVVMTDGLLASHMSQINEIVYEQAGIKPVNVKYIQKN